MNKLRITYLTTDTRIAGAENVLLDLLGGLDRSRFELSLITMTGEGGLLDRAARLDVPSESLGMSGRFDLLSLARLPGRVRRQRPDILHTLLFHANGAGRVAGRLARVPAIVSSFHGEYRRHWYRRLERMTLPLADRVVSVSRSIRRIYLEDGVDEERWTVIPNGIGTRDTVTGEERASARRELGLPEEKGKCLIAVARLEPEKGLSHLIRAMPAVLNEYPEARLLIAGEGSLREKLAEQVERSGLEDRIRFLGRREDVERILLAGDIFVLPSLTEGMPRTILEAANAEIPIVASRVGGIPEMIDDGESALLVAPGDRKGLAAAIRRLLRDRERAERLARKAKREITARFSLDRMIESHEKLYLKLAEEKDLVHRRSP